MRSITLRRTIIFAGCLLQFTLCRPEWSVSAEMKIGTNGDLYLIGEIISGDFDRFRKAIRAGGPDIGFVQLRSSGGSVTESMRIGRLIRALYMNTNAPPSAQSGYTGPYCSIFERPCICASACFNIWVAGIFRYGDEVHIHRISFDKDFYGSLSPSEAAVRYEQGLRLVQDFLREMGVPDKYFERMVRISSSTSEKIDYFEANRDFGFRPTPGIEEWLIARCGSYIGLRGSAVESVVNCYQSSQKAAQREAIQKFMRE